MELPRFLCSKCGELLTQFKTFKETCIESDLHLRKAVSNATFPLLPVESIKVESQTFDEEDILAKPSPPPVKRKRKPTKKQEVRIGRRRTRAQSKSPEKEEEVENSIDDQEDDNSECHTDRRRTRARKKSIEKVESSSESDDQEDYCSDSKQEVDDRSDGNEDEEFDVPPKKKEPRSQPSSDELPYSCTKPKCRKRFRDEHRLEAHIKKHDGIDVSQTSFEISYFF
jgi:hypothetical protein